MHLTIHVMERRQDSDSDSMKFWALAWKWYSLMPMAGFSRIMHPATKEIWSSNSLSSTRWLGLQIPKLSTQFVGCAGQTSQIHEGPISQHHKGKIIASQTFYIYRNCLLLHLLNHPLGVYHAYHKWSHLLEKTRGAPKKREEPWAQSGHTMSDIVEFVKKIWGLPRASNREMRQKGNGEQVRAK